MQKKLLSKIEFEWEKFYLDCMRTSKDNIFAKSKEISMKKAIQTCLKETDWARLGLVTIQKVLAIENVIESCYRYVTDYDYAEKDLQKNVRGWLNTL